MRRLRPPCIKCGKRPVRLLHPQDGSPICLEHRFCSDRCARSYGLDHACWYSWDPIERRWEKG